MESAAIRTRLVLAALVLLWIAPAPAANLGAIAGSVKDPEGQPIGDATVTLTSRRLEKEGRRVTTEWDGYYRFPDLPAGKYELLVEKSGFGSFVREGVIVKELDSTTVEVAMSAALAPAVVPAPAATRAAATGDPAATPAREEPVPVAASPEPGAAADPAPAMATAPLPAGSGPSYKVKRRTFVGTILVVNPKVILVDLGMGREVKVHIDQATEIEGDLAVGRKIRVHAPVDTTSYRVATSIKVLD